MDDGGGTLQHRAETVGAVLQQEREILRTNRVLASLLKLICMQTTATSMNNLSAHTWDDFTALSAAVLLLTAGFGAHLAPRGTAWPTAIGGPVSATERFIGTRDIQEDPALEVAAAPADPPSNRLARIPLRDHHRRGRGVPRP